MNVAKVHQKKIAEDTLKMSIAGAGIFGGMTHAEAYRIVFKQELKTRLEQLIREYPDSTNEHWVSTELDVYGWSNTSDWIELLNSL